MIENKLILLTRSGCCLCEGLEERLRVIPLDQIKPPLQLYIHDIDGVNIPSSERSRYSLEVPILLVEFQQPLRRIELPRVSPRLSEEFLLQWLQKVIQAKMGTK